MGSREASSDHRAALSIRPFQRPPSANRRSHDHQPGPIEMRRPNVWLIPLFLPPGCGPMFPNHGYARAMAEPNQLLPPRRFNHDGRRSQQGRMRPFARQGGLWKMVPLALALWMIPACTFRGSMRTTVNLSIDAPGPNTIQAWGYPSPDKNPAFALYNSMGINLRVASPFIFVFPDGFKANSREIDKSMLSLHLAPISINATGKPVSMISHSDHVGQYWMIFTIGEDDHAYNLSLYSCKHTMNGIIGTPDGANFYNFPLRQFEIENLFQGPLRIGHDFVIIGYDCD